MTNNANSMDTDHLSRKRLWIYDILLIAVLLIGAAFRLAGLFWGEYQYLHPDERFLVWVGTDITPVDSVSAYFDTANSSLNPNNRGHGFYVYGTFPMFLTRYVVEWIFGHSGFLEMTQVGRAFSAAADLMTVMLVYLVAARLYNRRVAILGAAFSAATVLQIQQSHFFTMDTFMVAFSFLAFYFAVRVLTCDEGQITGNQFLSSPLLLPSLGFGAALGLAVASKLNAAPMAFMLPVAMLIRVLDLPPADRWKRGAQLLGYLAMAAATSLLVFRLFQPYAFSGPGFLGLLPNERWVANIKELLAQGGGDVDFPPAMQWARRPAWFSFQNLTLWGLGLPLGILAWSGFLWVGWRLLRGWRERNREWQRHLLIWGWTAAYFVWQSTSLTPSLRYQLPIYPTLAILAGWAVVALYDFRKNSASTGRAFSLRWSRLAAIAAGTVTLLLTFAYAFGFATIYTRPITRVEASRWIYQNIPGAITLSIQTDQGVYNQPLPFPYSTTIMPGAPYSFRFRPKVSGTLTDVILPHVVDQLGTHEVRELTFTISANENAESPYASAVLKADLSNDDYGLGNSYHLTLDRPVVLDPELTYAITMELPGVQPELAFDGNITLSITPYGVSIPVQAAMQSLVVSQSVINPSTPLIAEFQSNVNGSLTHILLESLSAEQISGLPKNLTITMEFPEVELDPLKSDLILEPDPGGNGYRLRLKRPMPLFINDFHKMILEAAPEGGVITIQGSGIANEGEWDDGLPLRMDGYDGFGGTYPLELNFNMYWDDNPDKLGRFTRILDQADYIVITSSRQWGSLPRLPERFPMTTVYYRNLIGCPIERTIEYCYNVAKPGTFVGNLGYDLVQVFQSDPAIGSLRVNDQFAEEAFTVYDHPKVFIFQKRSDYDPQQVQALLGATNFAQVVRIAPMRAGPQPANLMLPEDRLAEQYQAGTWSELFDTQAQQNRSQPIGVILWYLCVGLLGIIVYPLMRSALPGLADRGYPLARTAGMLLLAYIVWLAGSARIPFTRPTISIAIGILLLLGLALAYRQRHELRQELRTHRGYFLMVESLFLFFFIAFLLVRLGNPDLWHPWKGGEKPMDFSYFNAVLKSTTFPPYDPWYSGGYLNYYYFGFVLVGTLVKWLGIVPAFAYNLILPTLFAMIAMGAFSLVWNLVSRNKAQVPGGAKRASPFVPALAAALGTAVLGNLGTVRMLYEGFQKLAAPGGVIEGAGLATKWVWALRGFFISLTDVKLPYGIGDWYWNPSRIIHAPGDVEPITEFPFFTVLYADLHAHLFALPIVLLALAFPLSMVLSKGSFRGKLSAILGFLIGGLAIGALRPTNTWNFYPLLALGGVAVVYALFFSRRSKTSLPPVLEFLEGLPAARLRLLIALTGGAALVGLSYLLYQPFVQWYILPYSKINLWEGTHTPLGDYLAHWGLFLFILLTWMIWESLDWMAKTPYSHLRKLKPYQPLILVGLVILLLSVAGLILMGVRIAWFVVPVAALAGILLLRPNQPPAKRAVLFMVGTALVMTLVVEVIVLVGDIGRMNTVFKFYLQAWLLFAIGASAALGWLLNGLSVWRPSWRFAWQAGLAILVGCTALYPLMAGMAKIKDRIAPEAPHTLDGMAYMEYAQYYDEWGMMNLDEDYYAIQWLQENVKGSPVIVEANLRALYRWGSRFTIYTGLPGVVGWEWHQQQQRGIVSSAWVTSRIMEVDAFYTTTDLLEAQTFLRKYNVQYIILGQQERGHYPGDGLEKFELANGTLWLAVFRSADTTIYKVLP